MDDVLAQLGEEIKSSFDRLRQMQPEVFEFTDWAAYLLASYEAWFTCSTTMSTKPSVFVDGGYLLKTAL